LGRELVERYPKALVVAGQIIFDEDTAWNRALHNETAFTIQRRLQRVGVPMIVLPVQLNLSALGTDKPVRRQAGHLAA
jgi:ABC-type hemin transport system ATPase subunit